VSERLSTLRRRARRSSFQASGAKHSGRSQVAQTGSVVRRFDTAVYVRVTRRAVVMLVWLVGIASVVGVAAAAAASQFPVSVYPPPVKARAGGALTACPNPAGLERFNSRSTKLAVRIAGTYERISLAEDLRNSDRAWWPEVRHTWRSGKPSKEALNEPSWVPRRPFL
jgi:hypothetical protein